MSMALAFNGIQFKIINWEGQTWISSRQLAQALGYKDENSVRKIYERNKEEFSSMMSATVKMTVGITEVIVRIFSMRGCHLVGMFARTPIAKAFRKWVLDVIEKYGEQVPVEQPVLVNPTSTITASHQAQLKAIVDAKVGMLPSEVQRKAYGEIWSRFSRHFQIARYQQLPSEKMEEAVAYLVEMQVNGEKPLPQNKEVPAATRIIDEAPFIELAQEIQKAHEEVERILPPLQYKISNLSYSVSKELEKRADIQMSFIQDMDIRNCLWGYIKLYILRNP